MDIYFNKLSIKVLSLFEYFVLNLETRKLMSLFNLSEKFGFSDIRNVIERSSARETAMRVSIGSICRKLLEDIGVYVGSRVIQIHDIVDESDIDLNKGLKNGVQLDMGVVGDVGLIGVVVGLGDYYCSVLPIINNKFELAVRHKNTKIFGVIKWLSDDNWQTATIEDIPSYMKARNQ